MSSDVIRMGSIRPEHQVHEKHVLLVLPFMDRGTKLEHAVSTTIDSDEKFFSVIGEQYKQSRGSFRRFLSLRKLAEMYFVSFSLLKCGLVRVCERNALPSLPDESYASYEFRDVPWSPPIDSDHFLHFMEHPWLAERVSYMFRWVPQKKDGKLECLEQEEYHDGWGLQYVEKVDRGKPYFI